MPSLFAWILGIKLNPACLVGSALPPLMGRLFLSQDVSDDRLQDRTASHPGCDLEKERLGLLFLRWLPPQLLPEETDPRSWGCLEKDPVTPEDREDQDQAISCLTLFR